MLTMSIKKGGNIQQNKKLKPSFTFFFFKKQRNLDYIALEMNIFLNSGMPFICFIQFVRLTSKEDTLYTQFCSLS